VSVVFRKSDQELVLALTIYSVIQTHHIHNLQLTVVSTSLASPSPAVIHAGRVNPLPRPRPAILQIAFEFGLSICNDRIIPEPVTNNNTKSHTMIICHWCCCVVKFFSLYMQRNNQHTCFFTDKKYFLVQHDTGKWSQFLIIAQKRHSLKQKWQSTTKKFICCLEVMLGRLKRVSEHIQL
jgi:hypothetical protein